MPGAEVRRMEKHLREEVDRLLSALDFPALYRGYAWKNDVWGKGFPDILRLEREVTAAARDRALGLDHVREIARWGGLPDRDRIDCPGRLSAILYVGDGILADARARRYHLEHPGGRSGGSGRRTRANCSGSPCRRSSGRSTPGWCGSSAAATWRCSGIPC